MARWMDEKFQKNYIGSEEVSDTLIKLGEKYLNVKKLKDLPDFTKEAFEFFKTTATDKERKILGFFEPQFFVIESFEEENLKNWFVKYTNRCSGKDVEEMEFVPKAFRKIRNSFVSIDNFDNKEIFDDDVDDISEKEFKKQKKNVVDSDDESETKETSDDKSTSETSGDASVTTETSETSGDASATTGNGNK